MTKESARRVDGDTFTLLVGGEDRRYPKDNAGKRQAIQDGLGAIETTTVGQGVYLPSNAALEVVAAVLYPDGIRTQEAYQLVCRVTEKACAHIGYGTEVELAPPHVPFTARGAYRKRHLPVDPQLVLDELELAGTSSYRPRREANRRGLWNKIAWEVYGKPWSGLTEAQQAQIQAQVDAIAAGAGWEPDNDGADVDTGVYVRTLPVNANGARQRLTQYLQDAGGWPVPVEAVLAQAQSGAYGRAFYHDELAPRLATIVADVLQAHGYQAEPAGGEYRPVPVAVPPDATPSLTTALESLATVNTSFGPALLLRDVVDAIGMASISDWQAERLIQEDVLGQALRQLGFQAELTCCRPYHFQPALGDDQSHQVLLKEVRVLRDPDKKLSLTGGLAVYTPALTIDDEENTLVYLEMVGPKQSVKANWAALVGGDKVHWIGRQRVQLGGMKQHVRVQASLPSGWTNTVLIHKQASLKEMNPEQPFYLLDDGIRPIPPLFYAMLNKSLSLPLLASWMGYLWETGRECRLITLLDEGAGQGYAAWRVLPALENWQEIVCTGVTAQRIWF